MRLLLALIAVSMLLLPPIALAQSEEDYQVVKSARSESFVLPYTASNRDDDNPLVYNFDEPKEPSWILLIQNNQSYVPRDGARTIVRIQEPAPSEKYIEIAMYGDETKRYWVAVNTPETGYARMVDDRDNGWTTEGPISVSHTENGGLTVTNGKRVVLDRLDLNGFAAGSIAVYGNDGETRLANAQSGGIGFEILFGRFDESPLYYVPAAVMAGVGGLVIGLLLIKKRKPSD